MAELFDTPLSDEQRLIIKLQEWALILIEERDFEEGRADDLDEENMVLKRDLAICDAHRVAALESNDAIYNNFKELHELLKSEQHARDNEAKQVEFITAERDGLNDVVAGLIESNAKLDTLLNDVTEQRDVWAREFWKLTIANADAREEIGVLTDERDAALFTTDRLIAGIDEVIERV